MSIDRTLAIAQRLILQIVKDHRTVALIVLAPLIVMSLVGFSFDKQRQVLDFMAPAILGAFSLFFVFILTGVSFLRERAQGTLERLLATPVGRGDVLVGYLLGFLVFASLQAIVILLFTIYALRIHYNGALWQIFVFLMVLTISSVNLGIFISTFARNEFQVVQFIPIVLAPQLFLAGVFLPVDQLPWYFQGISKVLPLTYAIDGLREIMLKGKDLLDVGKDLAVLAGYAVALLALAALTVRRS